MVAYDHPVILHFLIELMVKVKVDQKEKRFLHQNHQNNLSSRLALTKESPHLQLGIF